MHQNYFLTFLKVFMKDELLISDLGLNVYCSCNPESKESFEIEICSERKHNSKACTHESVKRLLQPVPPEKLFRLSQKAFHERQLEFKVAAKQISEEAATLFKTIGKTMPVMWSEEVNILVMDQVVIKPPYITAQLVPRVEDERSDLLLMRIQKLLQHYNNKAY